MSNRLENFAFVGPSGSGKTYFALQRRLVRTMSVFLDVTGDVQGNVMSPDAALEWVSVTMADANRGGHVIVDCSGTFKAGGLGDLTKIMVRAMDETGKMTQRKSTLILDEVADVVLSSRAPGMKGNATAVTEMVRASKTGRHTGLSAWFISQRVQEIPRAAGVEKTIVFGVGDHRERTYYRRDVGGVEMVNALDAMHRQKALNKSSFPFVMFSNTGAAFSPWQGPAIRETSPNGRMILGDSSHKEPIRLSYEAWTKRPR